MVVFPTTGKRPEQNKMSGGDLDGDVYLAIWDKEILEHLSPEKMREPGIYEKFDDKTSL